MSPAEFCRRAYVLRARAAFSGKNFALQSVQHTNSCAALAQIGTVPQEQLRGAKRFTSYSNKEVPMRKLALGILAAAGVALSVPASAQGVYIGAGPVGVGIGAGPGWGYYNGYYDRYAYRPAYRSYAYDDYAYVGRQCRTVRKHINGHVRVVRRCW